MADYVGSRGFTGSQGPATGYTGSMGAIGETGLRGFTGSRAYTGSQGYTGSRGYSGWTGSRGFLGWSGSRGFTGSQGPIGWTGSRGWMGSQGYPGALGFTGSRGAGWTGSRGIPGDFGFTGSRGAGWTGSRGFLGFTGSVGFTGFTGSAGAGYTGSKGELGPLGYTGSMGIPGPIALEIYIVGETEDANTLPETANTGETWLVNDNFFVYHTDQWWDLGPARGPQGYVGSQGPQGLPSMIPTLLGNLITYEELLELEEPEEGDAYTINGDGHLYMYQYVANTPVWTDCGQWRGPTGDAGLVGYTGSKGEVGIKLNLVGELVDIEDRPDANTVPESTAYVIGSDLHFTNADPAWVTVANFIGPVGPIGYTGSSGPIAAANGVTGTAGAIQFANSGYLAASDNFVIDPANNSLSIPVNAASIQLGNSTGQRILQANGTILDIKNAAYIRMGYNDGAPTQARILMYQPGTTTVTTDIQGYNATTLGGFIRVKSGNNAVLTYPEYTFQDDNNTGLKLLGADTLGLIAGATSILEANTSAVKLNTGLQLANTTSGISFSPNRTAASANSVTRHIALYGDSYGFNITAGRMNIVVNTNANLSIVTSGGTDVFTFDTSANQASFPAGSNTAPSITFNGAPDVGMYRRAANQIGLVTAGSDTVIITSTGFWHTALTAGAGTSTLSYDTGSSPAGRFTRTSSSLRYKKDIEDLEYFRSLSFIENARPVWYRAKEEVNPLREGWGWYGLIAEEVAEVEPRLVTFGFTPDQRNEDGTVKEGEELVPDGVSYERMVVPIIQVLQKVLEKNAELEARLLALETA